MARGGAAALGAGVRGRVGREEEVITAARRLEAMQARTPDAVVRWLLGLGLAVSGRRDSAAAIVHALDDRMAPGPLAYIEHVMGDDQAALDLLERGYDVRSRYLPENTSLPWFDDLRDDPRFRALRAKLGLP